MHNRIIFRADSGPENELNYLRRCLAIAQMVEDDFECRFLVREYDRTAQDFLLKNEASFLRFPEFANSLEEAEFICTLFISQTDIIVLDGPTFNTPYQLMLKENGNKVLCIDHRADCHFSADFIVNTIGNLDHGCYSLSKESTLISSQKYTPIRRVFIDNEVCPFNEKENAIFLPLENLGDIDNITFLISLLENLNFSDEVKVVFDQQQEDHIDALNLLNESSLNTSFFTTENEQQVFQVMDSCNKAIVNCETVAIEYLATGGILYFHEFENDLEGIKSHLIQNKHAKTLDTFIIDHINQIPEEVILAKLNSHPLKGNKQKTKQAWIDIFNGIDYGNLIQISRISDPFELELLYTPQEDNYLSEDDFQITYTTENLWIKKKAELEQCFIYKVKSSGAIIAEVNIDLSNGSEIHFRLSDDHNDRATRKVILKAVLKRFMKELDLKANNASYVIFEENEIMNKAYLHLGYSKELMMKS